MQLRHVHAENVLSFGSGSAALDLDLGPGLTIFVGPNGGGKSSVLRTVDLGINLFATYGTLRATSPQRLLHQPTQPTDRMLVRCDIEWNTDEVRSLWEAFLIGALVPREDAHVTLPEDTTQGQSRFPFNAQRFWDFVDAVTALDFSEAIQGLTHQRLEATVDASSGRVDLMCVLPELGGIYEITRGDYWRPHNLATPSHRASLFDLYVRTLDPETRQALRTFWTGEGPLPALPSLTWSCLERLRPGEALTLFPFYGAMQVEGPWPARVWPLVRIDRDRNPSNVRWGHVLATLLQSGFVRWDDWHIVDPAPWAPGESAMEALRDGRLGAALLALHAQGETGHQVYEDIRKQFARLTGATLAYQVRAPESLTPSTVLEAWRRVRNNSSAVPGVGHDPIQYVPVQAVVNQDIPISLAGSGRAQLATLLTLFSLSGKILALDEPEQALHPSLQAQLVAQWTQESSQILLATHSPYLVPPGKLDRARYVTFDPATGCSRVTAPHGVAGSDLARYVRGMGDALWLFARVVVLVEGPGDEAAVATWFHKWLSKGGDAPSLDILFVAAGGKTAIMPITRILDGFAIPWVALFDADCLAKDGEVRKERRDGNDAVWEAWHTAGFLAVSPKKLNGMPWSERLALFPLSRDARSPQIFLRGKQPRDNLDTLPEVRRLKSRAQAEVDHGPNLYRWIAEQSDCPRELETMFPVIINAARAQGEHA